MRYPYVKHFTAIIALLAATVLVVGLSGASSAVHSHSSGGRLPATLAPFGEPSSCNHHCQAVRHAEAVHHAKRVHRAHLIHAAALRRAAAKRREAASHGYGADWWTTNTRDWACIRTGESGGNYRDYSGAYGIIDGDVGALTNAAQDRWALRILHGYGWGAWSTAPGCGL